MICRAAILFRMALGSLVVLLRNTGRLIDVRGSIEGWAADAGILTPPVDSSSILETWDEISAALTKIQEFDVSSVEVGHLAALIPEQLLLVTQCERIAIWAFLM